MLVSCQDGDRHSCFLCPSPLTHDRLIPCHPWSAWYLQNACRPFPDFCCHISNNWSDLPDRKTCWRFLWNILLHFLLDSHDILQVHCGLGLQLDNPMGLAPLPYISDWSMYLTGTTTTIEIGTISFVRIQVALFKFHTLIVTMLYLRKI